MKRLPQLRNAPLSDRLRAYAVIVCALGIGLSGCAAHRAKPRIFPWSLAANTHPITPDGSAFETESDALEPSAEEMSSPLLAQIAPPPSPLIIIRSAPARPRVISGSPAPKEPIAEPDVPQISPQLTPAEMAAAQQETGVSLDVAARNLDSSQGKTLNGTQQDLASKIRGFIAEAKDAAQLGDWTRARNAAKKAEVLSQELASSL
jgi:hypothetical protein